MQNKKRVVDFFSKLNTTKSDNDYNKVFQEYLSDDIIVNITRPFEEITGIKNYINDFWKPLVNAFPDVQNKPYILVGDSYEGRNYVSCTGNFVGTFQNSWLDIPPTGNPIWLRYAANFLFKKGKIIKAWFFFDVLELMRQAGFRFFKAKGIELIPPAPMTGDGIVVYDTDPKEGRKSLKLTNAMLNGLGDYDGKGLESMDQTRFWDVQNMMWYGPTGIGTTRGLDGFQKNHQIPFIEAFPDRGIIQKINEDYFSQIGNGNYSCDFGFPAMFGTHINDGWLGIKATGKKVTFRVVDFWRREGDRLVENWVFIDMIDILEQLDISVFEMMKNQMKLKNQTLGFNS